MLGKQLKVLTDMNPQDFETTVNEFFNAPDIKIHTIEYRTTFIGSSYQNTVEYAAFIEYEKV